jgi:hypothetical protein
MKRQLYWAAAIAVAGLTAACGGAASSSSAPGPSEEGSPNSGSPRRSGNALADRVAASCGISQPPGDGDRVSAGPGSPPPDGGDGGSLEWTEGGDDPGLSTDGPVTGSAGTLIGQLDSLQGSCPSLRLTFGAKTVTTDAETSFAGVSCQSIKRTDRIGAVGTNQADGTLAASCVTRL